MSRSQAAHCWWSAVQQITKRCYEEPGQIFTDAGSWWFLGPSLTQYIQNRCPLANVWCCGFALAGRICVREGGGYSGGPQPVWLRWNWSNHHKWHETITNTWNTRNIMELQCVVDHRNIYWSAQSQRLCECLACLKLANSQALFDPACNEVLAEILVDGSSRQNISSATGRFQRVSRCPMATYNEPGLSTHERRNTAKSKSCHAKVTVSLCSLVLVLWCKKT